MTVKASDPDNGRPFRGFPVFGPRPWVMGILNVTPDSFSDGGLWDSTEKAITRGRVLVAEGADIVDVGGESTRPGAHRVTPEAETARVVPVVRALAADGIRCSVDTTRATVALAAIEAGAAIVNDVSGGLADPAIRGEVGKAIVGQADTVDHLLVALLARGHVLLEGPPGTAKTLLAQCFAASLGLAFGRIQFTPDLMPGDILGSNLFNFQTSQFTLTRGPVFCELLLADEINRTPPKTQAALLEAMQERRVTLDGAAHALSPRFTVIATHNPIESQGVYPLPEAQLDRFLFKLPVPYPSIEEERRIVVRFGETGTMPDPAALGIGAVADAAELDAAAAAVRGVTLADGVTDYIVRLVRATRESVDIASGASPRAAVLLAGAARARAALDGRDYVLPDDVKALALAVLRHRLLPSPAAEIEGKPVEAMVAALVEQTEAPR